MKTINRFLILLAATTVISGCKKGNNNSSSSSSSLADQVTGNYEGSGEDKQGNPFVMYTLTVSKVSANRVKIAPANGGSVITPFECDLMKVGGEITNTVQDQDNTGNDVAFTMTTPIYLAFDTNLSEDFGGKKK